MFIQAVTSISAHSPKPFQDFVQDLIALPMVIFA